MSAQVHLQFFNDPEANCILIKCIEHSTFAEIIASKNETLMFLMHNFLKMDILRNIFHVKLSTLRPFIFPCSLLVKYKIIYSIIYICSIPPEKLDERGTTVYCNRSLVSFG